MERWLVYRPWVETYEDELLWYDHEHITENTGLPYNIGVAAVGENFVCRECGEMVPKGVRQYARMLKAFKDWNI